MSEFDAFFPKFEYAFTIAVVLRPAIILGPSNTGQTRAAVYVDSGTVDGRIKGRVMPMSGGDWAITRADDVLDFDARYLLELEDGTIVYLQNRGYRWAPAEAMAKMRAQEPVAHTDYYMRVSPRFEVAAGPHDWLNKYVFVGVAEKLPRSNRIHYFQVL